MTNGELKLLRTSAKLEATSEVLDMLAKFLGQYVPNAPQQLREVGTRMQIDRATLAFPDRDPAQSELLAGEYQDALREVWERVVATAEAGALL